jgi:hypothetical protein
MTVEEFNKAKVNAHIDGALQMIDSIQKNVINKLGGENTELANTLNALFDKCKEDLTKAKIK